MRECTNRFEPLARFCRRARRWQLFGSRRQAGRPALHREPGGGGAGQAGLGLVQVGQQAQHAFVVGRALGGHLHLARGAVQELHAQPRLELLHELRHAGLVGSQGLGGLGEAAGLHDRDEGA